MSESRPMPGDAVRLVVPWYEAAAGAVGVLGGMVGEPGDGGSITFNASTYRDDRVVRCSGGPASIWTSCDELTPTGETVEVKVWRFDGTRCPANAYDYTVTVPLWDWRPRR